MAWDGLAASKRVEARRVLAGTLGTEAAQCPPRVGRTEGGRLRKLCSEGAESKYLKSLIYEVSLGST